MTETRDSLAGWDSDSEPSLRLGIGHGFLPGSVLREVNISELSLDGRDVKISAPGSTPSATVTCSPRPRLARVFE